MTEQKLTKLLRHAYQWGRDNGSNRSEKNFNDFLQTEAVQQALSIANVVGRRELLLDFIQWLEDEHDIEFITPDKHEQLDFYLSSNSG